MTDSREKFCVRACEGIGTGELAAILEGESTLKQQFQGVVEQRDDALLRARERGVGAMLNISTRESEWDEVIGIADAHPDIWASVGIHPHDLLRVLQAKLVDVAH